MKTTLILAGASALLSGAVSAQTVTVIGDPAPSERVSFADLNIASQAGQDHLMQRVRSAAADVCLENNVDSLKTTMVRKACYNAAVADGYRQINTIVASASSGTALAAASLVIRAH